MKKRLMLLSLSLCTALSSMPFTHVHAADGNIVKVNGVEYKTMQEAIDVAGNFDTIELLENVVNGDGFVVKGGKTVNLNLNGHTYDIGENLVGSAGTKTLGIQILNGNGLYVENGTIVSDNAKALVQNYGEFSTTDVVLDLNTVAPDGKTYYTVSINNGIYQGTGTRIDALDGNIAIDAYLWPSAGYESISVIIDGCQVNGTFNVDGDGTTTSNIVYSSIAGSTINGDLKLADYIDDELIMDVVNSKVNDSYVPYLAPNMVKGEDGVYRNANAKVQVNGKYGYYYLDTLEEAINFVLPGETIDVLDDLAGNGIKIEKDDVIEVDFNGHKYTVDGNLVGSTGTETLGFQIMDGAKVTFKNGTIVTEKAKVLIQNYSDLTIENMVIDNQRADTEKTYYTIGNNNGSLVLKNSTVKAAEGHVAFDVYYWSQYYPNGVLVEVHDSKVVGDIEYGGDGVKTDYANNAQLNIHSIDLDGSIKETATLPEHGIEIWNGTFTELPKTNYLVNPNTAKFELNADGKYEVVAKNPYLDGGILVDNTATNGEAAIYFELHDIAKGSEVLVKLYSEDDKYLTYKKITAPVNGDLGCSFYTVGTSSSWEQDNWKAHDLVIPAYAELYIDGVKVAIDNVDFKTENWANFPGTAAPTIDGGILVDRIETDNEAGLYFELENLPTDKDHTYRVELYSGETYLTYKEITLKSEGILGCTFYTVGTSSSWKQDSWKAFDSLRPTHANFYIDGVKVGTDEVDFEEEKWAEFPGTEVAKMDGGILVDTTATNGEAALYFELHDVVKGDKVEVKLYSGEDYLTYKAITSPVNGDLGCSFYTVGTSSSWEQDNWKAYDLIVPTHADLYINGVKVATDKVDFKEEDWAPFAGTIETTIGGGILVDRVEADNEAGVYFELENLPTNKEHTYRVELYSGDTYLTYKEITLKSEGILGCTFYTVGTSSSWEQDNWKAEEKTVPTHAVFYIDGVKVGTDEVEFEKEDWYKFPGTEHAHGVLENVKEATCKEEGYTGDLVCPICGEVLEKGTVIEKETHDYKLDETTVKEATCTEDGYTGDMVCECGDIIKGEVIEALGHEDADRDGKCDECDADVEVILTRVEEIAEVLKELHEAVENGDLEALKEAVAKMEEVDAKYEDAEEATEEEIAELIELMGCETEDELFEMILTDTLVASFVLELEEPYNAFKEERTLENAEALIEAVYDPENLEYFAMFYDDIEDLYAEAEELVAEAKEDEKPSDDKEEPKPSDKEENKPSDDKENDKEDKGDSPVTGDSTNIAGLSFAFLASLVGILYALINKKRVD